jgi:hypothetical protein
MQLSDFACKFVTQMAKKSLKAIVWLWALTLSASTIGVSVQQIYCYCVGQTTVGIFEAEDACASGSDTKTCCTKPVTSCCAKPEKKETSHGCTSKTTRLIQLRTEFIPEKKTELPAGFQDIELFAASPVFLTVPRFTSPGISRLSAIAHSPPLSGRQLCIRYQIFRC